MSELIDREATVKQMCKMGEMVGGHDRDVVISIALFVQDDKSAFPTISIPVAELDTTKEDSDRPIGECKTCKHFVRGGLDGKTYVCEHPYILLDDNFDYACITMNWNDFCSRYFPREGEENG